MPRDPNLPIQPQLQLTSSRGEGSVPGQP
jgi:hypothetical protein